MFNKSIFSFIVFGYGVSVNYNSPRTFMKKDMPWNLQVMRHSPKRSETLFWVNHNPFAEFSKRPEARDRFVLKTPFKENPMWKKILCKIGIHDFEVRSWWPGGGEGTDYCRRCNAKGESDNTRV